MRTTTSSPPTHRHGTRARTVLALAAALLLVSPAAAQAAPGDGGVGKSKVVSGQSGRPQPLSKADRNPGGANNGGDCGAYCSTRDGSPAQNGQGRSGHEAGSKGRADNKFPPGQAPDGSDANNGYECDGNRGVGVGNPAHSGCATPPPVRCVGGQTVTVTWPGVELGNPRWAPLVPTATTSTSLLPGTYTVTLTSTDRMHSTGFQTSQTREQWFVVLTLGGTVVATTGTIADLPDALTTLTQQVGTVTLTGGADTAVATHVEAGGPWTGAHSVEPTTAVFTCV